MTQRSEPSTSKSVRKWMASGSVTSRFLFSTSFFSLPHLERQKNNLSNVRRQNTSINQSISARNVFACLQSPSGMSSRLLLAAMNSVRLDSLPTPGGTPSKSSLLELTYSFFSLDSLQIADWREPKCRRNIYI